MGFKKIDESVLSGTDVQKKCNHDFSDYGTCLKCGYYDPDYDDLLYGCPIGGSDMPNKTDMRKTSCQNGSSVSDVKKVDKKNELIVNESKQECNHNWVEENRYVGDYEIDCSGNVIHEYITVYFCKKCKERKYETTY